MKRRRIVIAALIGIAVVLLPLLKPADRGAPHDAYFSALQSALRDDGIAKPVLVLDLDRLDANIDQLHGVIAPPRTFRIVAKSLPSVPLVRHIAERTGSRALMVFHEPFMRIWARAMPAADQLVGKPLPVAAARRFYAEVETSAGFDPVRQVQWLVDSETRLRQYHKLAQDLGRRLRVNIEIDVGLHRGGLAGADALPALLDIIAGDPDYLEFTGLMGYDAHVAHAPPILSSPDRELRAVLQRYEAFVEAGRQAQPALFARNLTLNGAGSKTYPLYGPDDVLNDLAVGSGLVKPSDFDVPSLAGHSPALWIAAPVLKRIEGVQIPFVPWLGRLMEWWNANRAVTYFIYGGGWLAGYASPAGLLDNNVYGFSTNQAIVNGSARTRLAPDDFIFLRPTQSERVMLEFGDIVVVRGGTVIDHWPVLGERR